MLLHIAYLLGGLVLLFLGAGWLVRGAASLALRAGVSALVIGLTVVAFGTSAPELVVSVQAALGDVGGIAIGNVVGSNIANIALILGAAALIRPVQVEARLVRLELPLLVLVSGGLVYFLADRALQAWEGAVLIAGLVGYVGFTVYQARRERTVLPAEDLPSTDSVPRALFLVAVGLGALVVGASGLVQGAVALAEIAGVPPAIIGLTLVAVGTSLPELATSVVAARRGSGDMAIGNVVGSNLFNALGILGIAALVHPLAAPGLRPLDLAAMLFVALLLLPLARSGFVLSRREGTLLLALYGFYMVLVVAV